MQLNLSSLFHFQIFKILAITFLLNMCSIKLFAQISQNGIFFQAVAKDNYDNPANRRYVFIQSSIIQSSITGPKVFIEEFQTTTDQAGIFTICIGKGIKKGGAISKLTEIDWASGPYLLNLKIVITPIAPGANWDYTKEWIDIGTTSFGTVPYALYASSSGDLGNKVNISDSILKYVTPTQLKAKTFDVTPIIYSLTNKVDKVVGKELSSNDFTTSEKIKLTIITGVNSGDESLATIKSKLGITSLSGANTGDQDLSSFATITNLGLKVSIAELDSGLSLKANSTDMTSLLGLKANTTDLTTGLSLKANSTDMTSLLGLKANTTDLTSGLAIKVDKVTGKELSTNDYTTTEKTKLAAITGTNGGDETTATIKTKLGISTLSGSNSGDQDLSLFVTNTNLALKANTSEVSASLALKANSLDVTTSLGLKVNVSDFTTGLALKANSLDVTTNLGLKANTLDMTTSLGLKANATDVVIGLSLKEEQLNKSAASNLGGTAANDILYPTQKAVKAYVDGQISSGGVSDASILTRHIASLNITTPLIADASITDIKISNGISQSKVGLGNVENTAISTWQGSSNLNNLGTITSGIWSATSVAIAHGGTGANTAADARFNLGLVIGTNVQAPLIAGANYIVPNVPIVNATKTKITYDVNGLVTAGADATTLDIAPSVNRNYVTDIQSGILSNTSGVNFGDETLATIKSKLGITTLSGSNTGDQDISSFATITNLALKANSTDLTSGLALKANSSDMTTSLGLKANTVDMTTSLGLKANTTDITTSLGLKANATDLVSGLALKVDKVTDKELSTNDYTTIEKNKLTAITGTNTGDETLATIKAKLAVTILSGDNSGDETLTTIKTKLGIATLSGSNTGDQDLSSFASALSLADKANATDVTTSLALKANLISPTLVTPILGEASATSVTASGDLKAKRFINSLVTASPTIDLTTGNLFQINLTSNISFSLPTVSASNIGTYLIKFTQDATGSRVVTFANNATTTIKLLWSGGGVPAITATPSKTDIMTIICDGVKYYATIVQNF
jgi:hypothetical protein